MCSAPVEAHERVPCGPLFHGWRDVALLLLLPAPPHKGLSWRLEEAISPRPSERRRRGDACGLKDATQKMSWTEEQLFCQPPGVWWADQQLMRATHILVADCVTFPCGEPLLEVAALRARGVRVNFSWFECAAFKNGEDESKVHRGTATMGPNAGKPRPLCNNLFAKLLFALQTAMDASPDLHYVLKVDTDTMLFPSRALALMRTLSASAGAHQPLLFGSHEGTSGLFMQGHGYGLNGAAVRRVLASCPAITTTPIAGSSGWNEDGLLGRCARKGGTHLVHCGHFRAYGPAYAKENAAEEYPLPLWPITLHKTFKLPRRRKAQLPDGLCHGAGWNCLNQTASRTVARLAALFA